MSHTRHHFDKNLCTAITFALAIQSAHSSHEMQADSFFRRIIESLEEITHATPAELLVTMSLVIDDAQNERPHRQDYPINEHGIIRVDHYTKTSLRITVITDCSLQDILRILQLHRIYRTLDDTKYSENPHQNTYLHYT